MADIFLSYASEDRHTASTLAAALTGAGWTVWWDQDIRAGDHWDQTIERELEDCRLVLALFSTHSVGSRWVRAEAMFGLEHRVLLPVVLDDSRLPVVFTTVQALTWSGATDPVLDACTRTLAGETGAPASPPTQVHRARQPIIRTIGMIFFVGAAALVFWAYTYMEKPSGSDAAERYALVKGPGKLEKLEALTHDHPDFAPAWADLSHHYYFTQQPGAALKAAQRAVALDPRSALAHLMLGRLTAGSEQTHHFNEAVRLGPDDTEVLTRSAFHFGTLGDRERALALYERAIELDPNNPAAHRSYARVLGAFSKYRYSQSLAHMDRATELDGQLGFRAPYYFFAGDLFGGHRALWELFEAHPNADTALTIASWLEPQAQLRWADVAEALDGDPAQISNLRVGALIGWGEIERAQSEADAYAERYPDGNRLDLSLLKTEQALLAADAGDDKQAHTLRVAARSARQTELAPYRTIEGYRMPRITEIWYAENTYFELLLAHWGLREPAAESMAVHLTEHWATLRMTNIGVHIVALQQAFLAAHNGDFEAALRYLDDGHRRGLRVASFLEIVRRFDVDESLKPLLDDPRLQALAERSREAWDATNARVEEEIPLLLNPDVDAIRAMVTAKNAGPGQS